MEVHGDTPNFLLSVVGEHGGFASFLVVENNKNIDSGSGYGRQEINYTRFIIVFQLLFLEKTLHKQAGRSMWLRTKEAGGGHSDLVRWRVLTIRTTTILRLFVVCCTVPRRFLGTRNRPKSMFFLIGLGEEMPRGRASLIHLVTE